MTVYNIKIKQSYVLKDVNPFWNRNQAFLKYPYIYLRIMYDCYNLVLWNDLSMTFYGAINVTREISPKINLYYVFLLTKCFEMPYMFFIYCLKLYEFMQWAHYDK